MLRIGLIGFGTIGRAVAQALGRGEVDGAALAAVLVRSRARLRTDDPTAYGALFHDDFAAFVGAGLDWAVEAGGHEALRQWGPAALSAGVNLIALSAGALADAAFHDELVAAARAAGRRVLVPSGGIGTLDVLSSAALGQLDEVRLTSRKPPRALLPPDQAARVVASGRAELLFDGPAREAARRFPENLNICAALALSGIGLDRTRVTVYADPGVERNTHRVTASGYFGDYEFTLRNVPSENPKTGRIVALSVVKTLRNLTRPLVVGA